MTDGAEVIWADPNEVFQIGEVITSPSRVYSPHNVRSLGKKPQDNVFVEPREFGLVNGYLTKAFEGYSGRNFDGCYYLSRRDYSRRVVTNADELESLARRLGLKSIDLSSLTAIEQIAFWKNCDFVVGPLASWVYLAGLGRKTRILALNSDWDHQWWAELSGIDTCRGQGTDLILGERLDINSGDTSESAPHREWALSKRGVSALESEIKLQLQELLN
jgi:hypothetical protein